MMGWLRTLATRDESAGALGRHAALLASLVLLLVAMPLVQALLGDTPGFPLLIGFVLVAAVFVNSQQRWIFIVALIVGIASITGSIATIFIDSATLRVVGALLDLGLLSFTTLVMLNSLAQTDRVSHDTMVGGACVYLLVGLCFALTFIIMSELQPGTFSYQETPLVRSAQEPGLHAARLLYYSFVTLTTLGYGDITPEVPVAQMFAVSEAVIGQLYLTVFLARLVALFVAESRSA